MKRGLITWDRAELPQAVFESRIDRFRDLLRRRRIPAGAVYSDLWRSNAAWSLQNFMPYFNRGLLVVPAEGKVVLFCGLSPRVYDWIRTVTPITDIRPAKDFAGPLEALATENRWDRIGVADEPGLPFDMHAALMNTHLELIDIGSEAPRLPIMDAAEIGMRRRSVTISRLIVEAEIDYGMGRTDFELVGRLERALRSAGAEDVVLMIGQGGRPPSPAWRRSLGQEYSLSAAVEYRGHWSRISRTVAGSAAVAALRTRFEGTLGRTTAELGPHAIVEDLSSGLPYVTIDHAAVRTGMLAALHVHGPERPDLVYGDTCIAEAGGWSLL